MKKLFLAIVFLSFHLISWGQTAYWKVHPVYDTMDVIGSNMIMVKAGNKYGVINYDGKIIAPAAYKSITPFYEGYALLLDDDMLKGILDKKGKLIKITDEYYIDASAPYFSEGLLAVKNADGRWGYMTTAGDLQISCKYTLAYPFSHGYAAVRDTYFVHVDSSDKVNYLGDGFYDDKLVFASSFTSTDEGPIAILVNEKGKILRRSISGTKVGKAVSGVDSIDGKSRMITAVEYHMKFNSDWTLKMTSYGNDQKEYSKDKSADANYKPSVSSLSSGRANGAYDLRFNGKVVLPEQFTHVIPLNDQQCAVSLNGKYGVLEVVPGDGFTVLSLQTPAVISHHTPVRLAFPVSMPEFLGNAVLEKFSVTASGGKSVTVKFEGNQMCLDYLPSLSEGGTGVETFDVSFKLSGLTYPSQKVQASFVYEPAFKISWPAKIISLDSQGNAVFDVVITNESDASDECVIFVDKKQVGTYKFSPKQGRTIQLQKAVNIEDEDQVTKTITLVIHENGCPRIEESRRIVFERYYIND